MRIIIRKSYNFLAIKLEERDETFVSIYGNTLECLRFTVVVVKNNKSCVFSLIFIYMYASVDYLEYWLTLFSLS